MKRQQITVGSFFTIKLPCDKYGYGRILNNANYAFYDLFTSTEETDINNIVNSKVLFIVAVYNDAINSGRWPKISKQPLEDNLKILPMKFIQNILNPTQFELYDPNTGETKKAKKEDCIGLEVAAVWEAYNVEERLCDHIAGKPNQWIEKSRKRLDDFYGS